MFAHPYSPWAQLITVGLLMAVPAAAQQRADPDFHPAIPNPAYVEGTGPRVAIDAAHHNFHTADGRYAPFADLIGRDGYRVTSWSAPFTVEALTEIDVLVIANAAGDTSEASESLPTRSAFTAAEVEAVRRWVSEGGSLLLIADHMPSAGAAAALAAAFRVYFTNGYTHTVDGGRRIWQHVFRKSDGTLRQHPIVHGRDASERIDSVATFTGQAFQASEAVRPLLAFDSSAVTLMTVTAGEFGDDTPRVASPAWYHAAVSKFGKGRVAFFGEAAMFTAQVVGERRRKIGMNSPHAEQNPQFILNLMHWLSGLLEAG